MFSHLLYPDTTKRVTPQAPSSSISSSISSTSSTSATSSSPSSSLSMFSLALGKSSDSLQKSSPKHSLKSIHMPPKYVGDHYPLIHTISPQLIPAHVTKNHAVIFCARTMAQMHNTLIRAINSSYNHALSIQVEDVEDYLFFNKQICEMIHQHLATKVEYLFPEIERLVKLGEGMGMGKGVGPNMDVDAAHMVDMDTKVDLADRNRKSIQHERFMARFRVFEAYVDCTKPAEYVRLTFRHLIESFAPYLIQNLHDEIPALTTMAWNLDSGKLMKTWKKAEEMTLTTSTNITTGRGYVITRLGTHPRWLLGCQDRSFKLDGKLCAFPNMPVMVQLLVVRFCGKKHEGAWRWCPNDMQGRKRFLPQ